MEKKRRTRRRLPRRKKRLRFSKCAIGAAFMSMLGGFAALPYQLGDVATIIPPDWKAKITVGGFVAAFLLRIMDSRTVT